MWVLRSKVNNLLLSDVLYVKPEFVWNTDTAYTFAKESDARFAGKFLDPENVWQMVAEEISECL